MSSFLKYFAAMAVGFTICFGLSDLAMDSQDKTIEHQDQIIVEQREVLDKLIDDLKQCNASLEWSIDHWQAPPPRIPL
jgi:uncharacterized coiled-coil protein SlyX